MRTVSQASVGCVEAPDGLLTAAQPGRHGLTLEPTQGPGVLSIRHDSSGSNHAAAQR